MKLGQAPSIFSMKHKNKIPRPLLTEGTCSTNGGLSHYLSCIDGSIIIAIIVMVSGNYINSGIIINQLPYGSMAYMFGDLAEMFI